MRRFHDAQRSDGGSDMFRYVFIDPYEEMRPPLDPAADIVAGLGRNIPSRVSDWALTAVRPPGADRVAPAWVLDELLRFPEQEHFSAQPWRPRPRSARRLDIHGARLGPVDAIQFGPRQSILRILFAPEKDGKRVCTVVLHGYPGHEPEDDSSITFTIDTGRGRRFAPRPAPPARQS